VLADGVLRGLSTERERSFIESVTDAETGLFQGSFMAFKLEEEFKRSWRFRLPLAVVLFDLPQMNDLGDERGRVLGEVAGVLLNECRDIDVIGRYDDTSFLLLLPSTGANGASVLAHRVLGHLRDQIKAPVQLDPAIAIVAVPRTGVNRKDDLLDLARLTLVSAWAAEGDQRVCLA
ncbi:MAG: GGDEF domain-containing protein, partial [Planctomycetota bacterium]|nr:GGDEF domain-containing protein [Planctomycetota bacterium]